MEATRKQKERQRKENKDDPRNSNVSLKQSESISIFALLSTGSLSSEERASCVEPVCVCVRKRFGGIFRACTRVYASGLLRERGYLQICAYLQDG